MFIFWYVIAAVVAFVSLCYVDKHNHDEVTVGDLLFSAFLALIPYGNIVIAVIASIASLIIAVENGRQSSGWLRKKVF